eukprot:1042413-Rhodomonas_salina.1
MSTQTTGATRQARHDTGQRSQRASSHGAPAPCSRCAARRGQKRTGGRTRARCSQGSQGSLKSTRRGGRGRHSRGQRPFRAHKAPLNCTRVPKGPRGRAQSGACC